MSQVALVGRVRGCGGRLLINAQTRSSPRCRVSPIRASSLRSGAAGLTRDGWLNEGLSGERMIKAHEHRC